MLRITGITLLIAIGISLVGCGGGSSLLPSSPPPPQSSGSLSISSISPTSAVAGSPDLTLHITGSNLIPTPGHGGGPTAMWSANGSKTSLVTTVVSSTQLTTVVPAALLSSSVTALVFVMTGSVTNETDAYSNSVSFIVSSPGSGGFTPTSDMEVARAFHTATLLADGKVLVAGGGGSTDVLASAEWFDPTTGSFTRTKGVMVQAREGHCAVLLPNGKILIAGGETSTSALKTAEIFDPLTDRFSPIEDMTSARWAFSATLLPNGQVLIAGGYDNTNAQASAELFDPATNSFTRIQNMTSARMHHTATLLASGKVLLTGGWSSKSPITVLATAELFDPFTNTFATTGSMSAVRAMHSASLLADDKVLILGGVSPMFSVASAELYDPASGAFTHAGLLNDKRHFHTATLLPSGSVLVAGGVHEFSGPDAPESEHLSSAELFDPVSGSSIFTGSLETGRVGHTATLLNSGQVLVVGGTALPTAELYQ